VRTVNAVARAVDILELLAASPEPLPVSVIATRLTVPRNTAYELVHTLQERGLVDLRDGRVALGVHLFELGWRYAESRPIAARLRDASGETVHVATLHGRHVTYLLKEESRQAVRMGSAIGLRLPAHVSAVGKAMLAALPPEDARRRIDGAELEVFTGNSITDPEQLMLELEHTRRRGYALDRGESSPGVMCVAAAVRDATGAIAAGLSISGPVERVANAREPVLVSLVREAAADLTRRLGGGLYDAP
jgi:IclR family KDG regulon transcriptional repressor